MFLLHLIYSTFGLQLTVYCFCYFSLLSLSLSLSIYIYNEKNELIKIEHNEKKLKYNEIR